MQASKELIPVVIRELKQEDRVVFANVRQYLAEIRRHSLELQSLLDANELLTNTLRLWQ